jgi:NADH:ubiquinone oxidoreductase subunit H
VIIRWTLPRFKYNQLMNLGGRDSCRSRWPNVMAVAVIGVLTQSGSPPKLIQDGDEGRSSGGR